MADGDDRATREREQEGPDAAAAVTSGGSSMARPGEDLRARASKREDEVADPRASGKRRRDGEMAGAAATAVEDSRPGIKRRLHEGAAAAAVSSKTRASRAPGPGAGGKRGRHEDVTAAATQESPRTATFEDSPPSFKRRLHERATAAAVSWQTRASRAPGPGAAGKRRRHEDVAAAADQESQRTAAFEDSRPNIKRQLPEGLGAAAPEEYINSSPPPPSEIVRAQDVLSLPGDLAAQIVLNLPRQMLLWQLNHQPASFWFHLRDGFYPSPDDLAALLSIPELLHIRKFSLVVQTNEVSDRHMANYLTRVSHCQIKEFSLEYHNTLSNVYILDLAACPSNLTKLVLTNITISDENLAITPMFPLLSVLSLSSVRISTRSLTRVVALCPALHTLSLTHISHLNEIVFEPPVTVLTSVSIKMCCNVTVIDLEELGNLKSFFYVGPLAKMYFSPDACVEDMILCSRDKGYPGDPTIEWLESAPSFSMLTVLTFSTNWFYDLSSGIVKNLNLNKLKELQVVLDTLDSTVINQFHTFLRGCVNLEKMFIQLGHMNSCHLDTLQVYPQNDQQMILRCLSFMKADQFSGNEIQLHLLTTLLLKAPGLKTLLLCSTGDKASLEMEVSILQECSSAEVLLIKEDGRWPQPRHLISSLFNCTASAEWSEEPDMT